MNGIPSDPGARPPHGAWGTAGTPAAHPLHGSADDPACAPASLQALATQAAEQLRSAAPAQLIALREQVQAECDAVEQAQQLLAAQLNRPIPDVTRSAASSDAGADAAAPPAQGPDDAVRTLLGRMGDERCQILTLASARTREVPPEGDASRPLAEQFQNDSVDGARFLRGSADQLALRAQHEVLSELEAAIEAALPSEGGPSDPLAALAGRPSLLNFYVLRLEAASALRECTEAYVGYQWQRMRAEGETADSSRAVRPGSPEDARLQPLREAAAEVLAPIVAAELTALLTLRDAACACGSFEAANRGGSGRENAAEGDLALAQLLQELADTAWLANEVAQHYPGPHVSADSIEPIRVRSATGGERIPFPANFFAQSAINREVCAARPDLTHALSTALNAAERELAMVDRDFLTAARNGLAEVRRAQSCFAEARRLLWPEVRAVGFTPEVDDLPLDMDHPADHGHALPPARPGGGTDWEAAMNWLREGDEAVAAGIRILDGLELVDGTAEERDVYDAARAVLGDLAPRDQMFRNTLPDGSVPRILDACGRIRDYGAFQVNAIDPTGVQPALRMVDRLFADDAALRLFQTDRPLWMQLVRP